MRHNHTGVIRYFPVLLCLYELIAYLSNDAYLPAMPSMANEFGVSHHLVMLTITAWFLGGGHISAVVWTIERPFWATIFNVARLDLFS